MNQTRRNFWKFCAAAPVAAVGALVTRESHAAIKGASVNGGMVINCEHVVVQDCMFTNIPGAALQVNGKAK